MSHGFVPPHLSLEFLAKAGMFHPQLPNLAGMYQPKLNMFQLQCKRELKGQTAFINRSNGISDAISTLSSASPAN